LGIETGVDLKKIMECGDFISNILKKPNLSSVTLADLELIPQRREQMKLLS
jgi:hypothetical protein